MDPVTQTSTPDLAALTRDAFQGCSISRDDALRVLQAPDDDVMAIVAAAGQVRRRFFGNRVKLNYLVNLKSGMCPEDCGYCSQSLRSGAQILRYSWLSSDEVAEAVAAGVDRGASTVCLVASGRGPSHREIEHVAGVVADIHRDHPDVRICTCLGFIDESKATRLADAGSSRYNHNLNTASSHYPDVCTTHTYTDRVQTVAAASTGGLSACSGLIAGMGESDEQLVDVAFGLRDLEVDSVPVNFLLPFEGTPLESYRELTPQRCLKTLAMVRFVHPDAEVRAAAGREYHLRTL
ncbi:MAG: biotin synthase BioB, partial [Micrococcales bacterium]